jgi:hypothetical protein
MESVLFIYVGFFSSCVALPIVCPYVLYTRVFIRKFPSIFEKPQNYVRPSAMQISNFALIKLMKVLKNNRNKAFVGLSDCRTIGLSDYWTVGL